MAGPEHPIAAGNVWERHKAEIGWLYDRMTLQAVKEHMEREEEFPIYSLSMWKKKVCRWGFDNKHNKRSTIEAAAVHFHEASNDRRCIPFAPSSGKTVSELELRRYLQRSKMVLYNGKLQPKIGASNSHISPSQCSQSPAAVEEDRVDPPLYEVNEPDDEPEPKGRYPSTKQQKMIWQHRKDLRILKMAYLFGQGSVRLADMMLPEPIHHQHTIFKAIADSIQSSWFSGMWSVDKAGAIIGSSRGASNALDLFIYGYNTASDLFEDGDISGARKFLWKASEGMLWAVRYMTPSAISSTIKESELITNYHSPAVAQKFLKATAHLIGSTPGIYPGIQRFFSSLSSIPPGNLRRVLQQADQVWSESFIIDELPPSWLARVDIWKIENNVSFQQDEKGHKLASYSNALHSDPTVHPDVLLWSFYRTSCAYIHCYDMDQAQLALQQAFDILEKYPYFSQNGYLGWLVDLKEMQSQIHFNRGRVQDAISDLEEVYPLLDETTMSEKLSTRNILATLYRHQDEQEKARNTHNEYMEMLSGMEAMTFEDTSRNDEQEETNSSGSCSNDDDASIGSSGDTETPDVGADVEQAWQSYVNGGEYDMKGVAQSQPEWRKDVDPSIRDHLTLCEPILDDGMELSAEGVLDACG